jgi:S1-C subfamily serine protease
MQTNQPHQAPDPRRRDQRRCLTAATVAALATPVLLLTATSANATVLTVTERGSTELTADSSTVSGTVTGAIVDIVSTETLKNLTAAGTGMILTPSGEILTNNHVINGATSIEVTVVATGRSYRASVVGTDPAHDVAVIQLAGASALKTMPIGDSDAVTVGQSVVARGNALGAGGAPNVVQGTVTALNQSITAADEGSGETEMLTGMIETNAPIVPGDSGGPLATTDEQVIGMDTAASSSSGSGAGMRAASTQAFAIPINSALSIAEQIESGQAGATVQIGVHGFLGIQVAQSSSATRIQGIGFRRRRGWDGTDGAGTATQGVRIAAVIASSAAAQAGLMAGDVITSFNGQPVDDAATLGQLLLGTKAGQTVPLGWIDASGQAQTGAAKLQAAAAD